VPESRIGSNAVNRVGVRQAARRLATVIDQVCRANLRAAAEFHTRVSRSNGEIGLNARKIYSSSKRLYMPMHATTTTTATRFRDQNNV
jgi:hypothetical protein